MLQKKNFSLYKICLKHIKKRKTFGVTGGFENEIQCATESIELRYCMGDFSK